MQLPDKRFRIKNLFKHFPKKDPLKPNQNMLRFLWPVFQVLMAIIAIILLLIADILPSTFKGGTLLLFIVIGACMNIGFCIYKPLADRLFKDEYKMWHPLFIFAGCVFYTLGVAVNNDFVYFWPMLITNVLVALFSSISFLLPPLVKPLETQVNKARRHFFHVMGGKYNDEYKELCWQEYLNNVREFAHWRQHGIPEEENFQEMRWQERDDILKFVTRIHLRHPQ